MNLKKALGPNILAILMLLPISQSIYAQDTVSREEFETLKKLVVELQSENIQLRNSQIQESTSNNNSPIDGSTSSNFVGINSEYNFNILDHAERTNTKQLYQLEALSNGMLDSTLTLGGQVTALVNYQSANEDTKFWLAHASPHFE